MTGPELGVCLGELGVAHDDCHLAVGLLREYGEAIKELGQ